MSALELVSKTIFNFEIPFIFAAPRSVKISACKKQGDHRHDDDHRRPIMWRGKRLKSPNNHGTRSLRDIFPVRATINADMPVAAQTSKLESEDDGDEAHKKTWCKCSDKYSKSYLFFIVFFEFLLRIPVPTSLFAWAYNRPESILNTSRFTASVIYEVYTPRSTD